MRSTQCPTARAVLYFSALAAALSLSACKSASSNDGTGGSNGSGGSSSSGGSNGNGGSNSSGGSNGSGGSSSSGGSTGSGGSVSSGGSTGNGGSTGSGGSAKGGSTGTGGASTGSGGSGAGGSGSGSATFAVTITQSTAVATVEIVTWSVNVSIDSAVINFGRDQSNFEFQAPVDLTQSNYRTLLLGMKQNTKYYVQVVAKSGGMTYSSDVKNVTTGYLANGAPTFTVSNSNASALYAGGGFTVGCTGLAGIPGHSTTTPTYLFVVDKDGALVWLLDASNNAAVSNCSRARMSYDGQYLFAGNFANTSTAGAIYRIGMDGMGSGQSWMLPGRSHDFAILPNGNVVYFKMDNSMANTTTGPEEVMELDTSTGNSTLIYDEKTDFGTLISSGTQMVAHTNSITYSPQQKAITISMFFLNTIAEISYPGGKLLDTFGGMKTNYTAMTWTGEHGHDVWSDHIWVFHNTSSSDSKAHVLGFNYDSAAKTATQTLDYSPGLTDQTFGDVKELPNGNLFVTWSEKGEWDEITKTGTLLGKVSTTVPFAYLEHRGTMYGPPPPFAGN